VPAGLERALRRRIRSVESTQKITRAMELIAGSRIARSQQAIAAAKPYAERMNDIVSELAADPEAEGHWAFAGRAGARSPDGSSASSLGTGRPVVVVLGSDRGLAGAFNLFVQRAADELLSGLSRDQPVLVAVGRKAVTHFRLRGQAMEAHFEGMSDRPRFDDARRVVGEVAKHLQGGASAVWVVSMRFFSAGVQRAESRRLVPMERREHASATVFEFEPGPAQIMDTLLPRWLEAEVFAALLESAASFHVFQQRAMAAATDNAEELIKTLRRLMNRARQDSITTEIMEIVGGAEALRQGAGAEAPARPDVYVFPEAS
jgi:F-type H+-transporting ATPase subunit gamma